MIQADHSRPEMFQPIALRFDASVKSRMLFWARRAIDLQFSTIWDFLGARLGTLRGNLLDVGCGDMPYRSFLPPGVAYTGMDVPQAGDFAMRGNGDVLAFDGLSIPFPDNSFDTILCTEVLEHAAAPEALVAEIRRVLKSGGTLIATVPFSARVHYAPHDYHRFTRHALSAMLSAFADVEIAERGNDIAVIANKLTVLALRMTRPTKWSPVHWPLLLLVLPLAGIFTLAAHVSMRLGIGSLDDPLGYAVVARK